MWRDGRGCGADREGGSQPQHGHHPPCCGYETADVAARRMSGRRWEGRTPKKRTADLRTRRAAGGARSAPGEVEGGAGARGPAHDPHSPPQRGPDRGGGFEQ